VHVSVGNTGTDTENGLSQRLQQGDIRGAQDTAGHQNGRESHQNPVQIPANPRVRKQVLNLLHHLHSLACSVLTASTRNSIIDRTSSSSFLSLSVSRRSLSISGAVPNPPAAAYCKRPATDSVEPFLIPICWQVQSLSFTRSERFTSSTSCHLPDMYLATWPRSTDMFNPYGSIF